MNRKEFIELRRRATSGLEAGKSVGLWMSVEQIKNLKEKAKSSGVSMADYMRSRLFYEE